MTGPFSKNFPGVCPYFFKLKQCYILIVDQLCTSRNKVGSFPEFQAFKLASAYMCEYVCLNEVGHTEKERRLNLPLSKNYFYAIGTTSPPLPLLLGGACES